MGNIILGIKLRYDGQEVDAGVTISRDHLRQFAADAKRAGDSASSGFSSASQGVRSMSQQLEQVKNAAAAYFSATQAYQGAGWVVTQASLLQQLEARLRVATSGASEFSIAYAGVFEIANKWGAAVEQTAGAISRLNPVMGQMGLGSQTTLKMLDGLSASLRLSGATAAETGGVLTQFAQAMGSGRVGGDEFRSMMESAEPLMRAVALQMGKTTGELRLMSEEGKLTSSVFANALLPAIDKLTSQAAGIPMGIGQAMQVLKNNLLKDFGTEFGDQANAVAAGIKSIAEHTPEMAAALHASGDALLFLGKAGAVVAAGAAASAITAQAIAAGEAAAAFVATRAARIADAQAAAAQAEAEIARTTASLAAVAADRERALAQRASAAATLYAAQAMGAQSSALAANKFAIIEQKAALLMLAETSRSQVALTAERVAAEKALTAAQQASAAASSVSGAAARGAGAIIATLGGPIGIVTAVLGAGAAAWALWGNSAESAAEKAKKKLAQIDKQKRFGADPEIADLKAENAQLESGGYRVKHSAKAQAALQAKIGENLRLIAELEKAAAESEAKIVSGVTQRASAAGEYAALTKELPTRTKLLREYAVELGNIQASYADKFKATPPALQGALASEHQENIAALLEKRKKALEGLPDYQEGKASAEARAEAIAKGWHESIKHAIEIIKQDRDQFRLSTNDFINAEGAFKSADIEQQIVALQQKLRAVTKDSERIKIRADISVLQEDLKQIPEQTRAALEDAAEKSAEVMRSMAVDAGKHLDPLEEKGREFAKKWGKAMQEAAVAGDEAMLEKGREVWKAWSDDAQFKTAKDLYEAFFSEMQRQIEAVREAAAQNGGVFAGLASDEQVQSIRARMLPALQEYIDKMKEAQGSNPVSAKTITEAQRATQKAASEISPTWKRISDDIERGLTDSIYRGFEAGKGFGENFLDSLRNMFKTTVLKVGIQGGVQWGMSSVGLGGAQPGNAGNMLNTGSNAYGLYNNGLSMTPFTNASQKFFGGGVDEAGYAAAILRGEDVTREMFTTATSEFGQAANSFAGAVDAYGGYVSAAYALSQGKILTAVGSAVGQYFGGPIGSAIGNVIGSALDGALGLGGGGPVDRYSKYQRSFGASTDLGINSDGGAQNYYKNNFRFSGDEMGASQKTFDAGLIAAEQNVIKSLSLSADQVEAINAELKKSAEINYGFGTEHTDWMQSQADEQITAVRLQAMATALGKSVLEIAAAMDPMFGALVKAGGYIGLTAGELAKLAPSNAQMQALTESIGGYYAAFYSESERLAKAQVEIAAELAKIGVGTATTKAEFRALVEGLDETTAAGSAAFQSLMALAPAFAQVADASDSAAKSAAAVLSTANDYYSAASSAVVDAYNRESQAAEQLSTKMRGFSDSFSKLSTSLKMGDLSTLSPAAKYQEAALAFTDISRRAQLGDTAAMEQLESVSESFLQASRDYNASSEAYAADFARVTTSLETAGSTASRQADISAQQLSALTQQISGLGLINTSVLSVVEAIDRLTIASAMVDQAGGSTTKKPTTDARVSGVVGAYNSILDRAPDAAGAAWWASSGLSAADINRGLVSSAEYTNTHLSGGIDQSIDTLYRDVLGRAPDAAGAAWWANSGLSATEIRDALYSSPEYQSLPSFDVGTNFVTRDTMAMVHRGEEIKPAVYVDKDRAEREETNKLLREEVVELRAIVSQQAAGFEALLIELRESRSAANDNTRRFSREVSSAFG